VTVGKGTFAKMAGSNFTIAFEEKKFQSLDLHGNPLEVKGTYVYDKKGKKKGILTLLPSHGSLAKYELKVNLIFNTKNGGTFTAVLSSDKSDTQEGNFRLLAREVKPKKIEIENAKESLGE